MNIEIKKSQKPVKYEDALSFMEKRLIEIDQNKSNDLIWILEHNEIYTAGKTYKEDEIIDKSITIFKTNRGGKITYHGPGQLICYFVARFKKKKRYENLYLLLKKQLLKLLNIIKLIPFQIKIILGYGMMTKHRSKKLLQ